MKRILIFLTLVTVVAQVNSQIIIGQKPVQEDPDTREFLVRYKPDSLLFFNGKEVVYLVSAQFLNGKDKGKWKQVMVQQYRFTEILKLMKPDTSLPSGQSPVLKIIALDVKSLSQVASKNLKALGKDNKQYLRALNQVEKWTANGIYPVRTAELASFDSEENDSQLEKADKISAEDRTEKEKSEIKFTPLKSKENVSTPDVSEPPNQQSKLTRKVKIAKDN